MMKGFRLPANVLADQLNTAVQSRGDLNLLVGKDDR